jgi:hypothetical protein
MRDLHEMLGARYGWTWCRRTRCYWWTKLYWPADRGERCQSQARSPGPQILLSGYRDSRRGRHWDRRRR